jgi:hypothetical protein
VRVFDLLLAPGLAQRITAAGKHLFGDQGDAVHVEQGAVGIEEHSFESHARTLFDT